MSELEFFSTTDPEQEVTSVGSRPPTLLEQLRGLIRFGMMQRIMGLPLRGALKPQNADKLECSRGCGTISAHPTKDHAVRFTCSDCWGGT